MTALAESTLIRLLSDTESLTYLTIDRMEPEVIPTEAFREVIDWSLRYLGESGRAPTVVALHDRFTEDFFNDREIDLTDIPEETIEWATTKLRSTFVFKNSAVFSRELATSVADAPDEERVDILAEKAAELAALVQLVTPRRSRVDLRQGAEQLWEGYLKTKASGGAPEGLLFGLPEFDAYTHGIHDSELALVPAPPKTGKAQPLDGLVMTPTGPRRMGDLHVGDSVVGSNGLPTRIVAVHPQGAIPIYRVDVTDHTSLEVSGGHLWMVQSNDDRQAGYSGRVRTTMEIRDLLIGGHGRKTYLPVSAPVEFEPLGTLPLDPYLLGLLLGNGSLTKEVGFTAGDHEQIEALESVCPPGISLTLRANPLERCLKGRGSGSLNPVTAALRDLGLMGLRSIQKFIPEVYLRASIEDRWALLQGLMDTDGGVEKTRSTYSTSSFRLAQDVQQLVESLGGTAGRQEKLHPTYSYKAEILVGQPSTILTVRPALNLGCPFRLPRKVAAWERTRPAKHCPPVRKIEAVEYVGVKEAQCITVAATDSLYLADHCLVTHNSWILDFIAQKEWCRDRVVSLFTLENSIEMTQMRLGCLALGISVEELMTGTLDDDDQEKLRQWVFDVLAKSDVPLHIFNPPPSMRTPQAIVQQANAVGTESLIIDQLTFMEAVKGRSRERQDEEIGRMMHDLKSLISTGRHQMPCVLAHQINRDGTKRAASTGKLDMGDLANSSETERTSDWVFGLNATPDQVVTNRMELQTLACRRVKPKHYELFWYIDVGRILVKREIPENEWRS
jgi:replicative DNA helicase